MALWCARRSPPRDRACENGDLAPSALSLAHSLALPLALRSLSLSRLPWQTSEAPLSPRPTAPLVCGASQECYHLRLCLLPCPTPFARPRHRLQPAVAGAARTPPPRLLLLPWSCRLRQPLAWPASPLAARGPGQAASPPLAASRAADRRESGCRRAPLLQP